MQKMQLRMAGTEGTAETVPKMPRMAYTLEVKV